MALRMWVLVAFAAAQTVASQSAGADDAGPALQVWSRSENKWIDEIAFLKALAKAPVVLLGEVHDNPLHHTVRARVVSQWVARRAKAQPGAPPPAAVFEHATRDRQTQFDHLNARLATQPAGDRDVQAFFDASEWAERGWPPSNTFAPLVRAVLRARMPIYAGDVPRERLMGVARGPEGAPFDSLAATEVARLKLDRPFTQQQSRQARQEIAQAHCGVMPKARLAPMAAAQRLRDATLADAVVEARARHGAAVLFAGNGHVRLDRGVPWYLRARQSGQALSVMIKERVASVSPAPTRQGRDQVSADSQAPAAAPAHADFVVWTAPHQRPDPCRHLLEKYGKTKR